MKGKEIPMKNLRQLLQRLKAKENIRGIFRETGTHRTIIRKMYHIVMEKEWLSPEIPMPTDDMIMEAWAGDQLTKEKHILDPYQEKIKEWYENKQTAVVIQRQPT